MDAGKLRRFRSGPAYPRSSPVMATSILPGTGPTRSPGSWPIPREDRGAANPTFDDILFARVGFSLLYEVNPD
jgi:hypothetical protein